MNITKQSKFELGVKLKNLYMKLQCDKVSTDFEEGYYGLIFNILDLKDEEITLEQWNTQLENYLDYTKSKDWVNGYNIALEYVTLCLLVEIV